jgi:DNA-binding transcriptional MerR regulator
MKRTDPEEAPYSVAAVVKATGLSAHVLRAWERRYGAIAPTRTAGGSRRYSEADVRRLQRLHRAVEAGHAIGSIAGLSDAALDELLDRVAPEREAPIEELLGAIERLDANAAERMVGTWFAALGPRAFASDIALPALDEIGRRWERGTFSIAAEHLASALLRSVLGPAVRTSHLSPARPIVFATPSGERHELGLLVAALCAAARGADPVYLGVDLPADEIAEAARRMDAGVVVLGITMPPDGGVRACVEAIRRALPAGVALWVGGSQSARLGDVPDAITIADVRGIERHVGAYLDSERLRS